MKEIGGMFNCQIFSQNDKEPLFLKTHFGDDGVGAYSSSYRFKILLGGESFDIALFAKKRSIDKVNAHLSV